MGNIYTSIDLGTDNIKVLVVEKHNDNYNILTSVSSPSKGISDGGIVDIKECVSSVKKALKKANDMLGTKITKVIACVSPAHCNFDIAIGSVDVEDYNKITGNDISNVLRDAVINQIDEEHELITAVPISFTIDDEENIKDPKGLKGKVLETKIVLATSPKEELYRILEVLKLSGVEAIDVAFTSTGDYYSIKNSKRDKEAGAIVNIGENTTNISIFNKGIQIKNKTINLGSINVDRDLSFVFNIDIETAKIVKETFAISMEAYADINDTREVRTKDESVKEIDQVEVSKVVESRLVEILNLVKKEIKNLTNREIRYIIITGGLSELAGFLYIVDEELGFKAKVCNITAVGIRHNKYSSVYGTVKYFDDKMNLRGKNTTMISPDSMKSIINTEEKIVNNNTNIISKVFGHFFDN
ncbi:MAG: cell division protein FtsA [Bacilli bacterium]|nr:cell division protein FtsA [Bacilli bacterium]